MFNKSNSTSVSPKKGAEPENKQQSSLASIAPDSAPKASLPSQSGSSIGRYTDVQGDIFSDENLTIDGNVEGTVTCKAKTVTLGQEGSLDGNIYAHTLHVSGRVEGNLVALEKVTIHDGANVSGTIITPNLIIEDGSKFRGNIDMDPANEIFERIFDTGTHKAPSSSGTAAVSKATLSPKAKTTDTDSASKNNQQAGDEQSAKKAN
ncbi:polymer-forming cytoskeletal protein [Halomonas sp. TBZ9]|uniref:Polymer-forming cytoskeletal protein n=1 Tax=Vreelandella azerica TaxID=2732867 RepID=A0A7Y3XAS3_9GAMM|nr:polymer-forming cytoskeletal protein [Halomonas azerica]NOG31515.1 polymer-forming cytoskeletal protein [Halomonas azerica]